MSSEISLLPWTYSVGVAWRTPTSGSPKDLQNTFVSLSLCLGPCVYSLLVTSWEKLLLHIHMLLTCSSPDSLLDNKDYPSLTNQLSRNPAGFRSVSTRGQNTKLIILGSCCDCDTCMERKMSSCLTQRGSGMMHSQTHVESKISCSLWLQHQSTAASFTLCLSLIDK